MYYKLWYLPLAIFILFSCGCSSQSATENNSRLKIKLAEDEKLYEGFICIGEGWEIFVQDLKMIDDPSKRYLLSIGDRDAIAQMCREGTEINWYGSDDKVKVMWVRFAGRETVWGQDTTFVSELNKGLTLTRVLACSAKPVKEALESE